MIRTKNFTFSEVQAWEPGPNVPGEKWILPCGYILMGMLQALRNTLGVPIHVTSGYRTVKHNKAIGGAKGSHHTWRTDSDLRAVAAVDIYSPELSVEELGEAATKIFSGQVIVYPKHVHVSTYGSGFFKGTY